MHQLTQLIMNDMKPALGVTEPGAIAFAMAKARSYTNGNIESIELLINSGMYKNAFTCGTPNSTEVGNAFAAALGVVAGDCDKELESLASVLPEDTMKAQKLIDEGRVTVLLREISSEIYIKAIVRTNLDSSEVTICHTHTNICEIKVNDNIIFSKETDINNKQQEATVSIHKFTLAELVEYTNDVSLNEISFIHTAYKVNLELFEAGLHSERTTIARKLLQMNHGMTYSKDDLKTAQLLCNTAIEARVIGLDKPAMSITGSGAHGIISTLPLYACYKVNKLTEEKLLRATALSYLVTMYIKEYSGKLSAFCGCAIAAGTGMACALVYLKDGTLQEMERTINNMASSITGMICHGGNQGCVMKGIVAVDAAFKSVELAMADAYIFSVHGINGKTPEETMHNMGLIASPGMVNTEKTIVDIMESKGK